MITAEIVPVEQVDRIWPLVSQRIIDCLEEYDGDCSAGMFWSMCRSGGAFLTVATDGEKVLGTAIWRFEIWGNGSVLRNLITVGEAMETWIDQMTELAEKMKKQGGAKRHVWEGRGGWGRKFPNAKPTRYTFEME